MCSIHNILPNVFILIIGLIIKAKYLNYYGSNHSVPKSDEYIEIIEEKGGYFRLNNHGKRMDLGTL